MRFQTSDPVPVAHMIGINPTNIVATVMKFERGLLAAPSTIAAWRSPSVRRRPSRDAFSYARSRYSSMKTPVSASTPSNAMSPTQTLMIML